MLAAVAAVSGAPAGRRRTTRQKCSCLWLSSPPEALARQRLMAGRLPDPRWPQRKSTRVRQIRRRSKATCQGTPLHPCLAVGVSTAVPFGTHVAAAEVANQVAETPAPGGPSVAGRQPLVKITHAIAVVMSISEVTTPVRVVLHYPPRSVGIGSGHVTTCPSAARPPWAGLTPLAHGEHLLLRPAGKITDSTVENPGIHRPLRPCSRAGRTIGRVVRRQPASTSAGASTGSDVFTDLIGCALQLLHVLYPCAAEVEQDGTADGFTGRRVNCYGLLVRTQPSAAGSSGRYQSARVPSAWTGATSVLHSTMTTQPSR